MNKRYERGMTLIEMMVSITILMIILAGFISSFVTQQNFSTKQQNYIQLVQRGRATVQYLQGRIREIGYNPTGGLGFGITAVTDSTLTYFSDRDQSDGVVNANDQVSIGLNGRDLIVTESDGAALVPTVIANEVEDLVFTYENAAGAAPANVNEIRVVRIQITLRRETAVSRNYPVTVRGVASLRN